MYFVQETNLVVTSWTVFRFDWTLFFYLHFLFTLLLWSDSVMCKCPLKKASIHIGIQVWSTKHPFCIEKSNSHHILIILWHSLVWSCKLQIVRCTLHNVIYFLYLRLLNVGAAVCEYLGLSLFDTADRAALVKNRIQIMYTYLHIYIYIYSRMKNKAPAGNSIFSVFNSLSSVHYQEGWRPPVLLIGSLNKWT